MADSSSTNSPQRKPAWLKVTGFSGRTYEQVTRLLRHHHLNTVCHAANCPNRGECFNRGTATFLIMGPSCTRNCRFCDVPTGKPAPLDPTEPERLATVSAELKLRHVVVTSVTRDDLPDGGAGHFAATVQSIRRHLPEATVELLTPDFRNAPTAPGIIIDSRPDVFNHNVETVPRLYKEIRPGADYRRSLDLLRHVHEHSGIITKSGLMVGLGETAEELDQVFADMVDAGVEVLTIGQYLSPSKNHHPVVRYIPPSEFSTMKQRAEEAGIRSVAAAPLVRSSYRAEMYSHR